MRQCESIESILKHVRFRCIDLEGTHLDDEMAVAMFEMVEYYESACKLNISFNKNIGPRGWQSCSRLVRKTPCLTFIDAHNCDLNERVIPIMGRALRMGCFLTRLQLQNTGLAGRALMILVAALKMNETLKELFIGDNKFMPTDGVHIGNLLKYNNKLELLDLRNNHLQDVGASHICDGLAEQILDTGLLTLVLWNNQITFQAMNSFCKALCLTENLETLNLGHNPITNEGIHVLKDGLLKSRSLLKLGLSGTKVTCEGAVALAEVIADSPRLVRLDLQENDIKTAGLMALSLALKVNESLTRLDIDRETKKESGMKDYADQQKRLQQDITSLLERNRDIAHQVEEKKKQIELKNQENARKLEEAARDIELSQEESSVYIPSGDSIHRPKLLFLPLNCPEHELDSPVLGEEILQTSPIVPQLKISPQGTDILSPQYCPNPRDTAKKIFSVTRVTSPPVTSPLEKGQFFIPQVSQPGNSDLIEPTHPLDIPQLCTPLSTVELPNPNSHIPLTVNFNNSSQGMVSPEKLQKTLETQTLVSYIQQLVDTGVSEANDLIISEDSINKTDTNKESADNGSEAVPEVLEDVKGVPTMLEDKTKHKVESGDGKDSEHNSDVSTVIQKGNTVEGSQSLDNCDRADTELGSASDTGLSPLGPGRSENDSYVDNSSGKINAEETGEGFKDCDTNANIPENAIDCVPVTKDSGGGSDLVSKSGVNQNSQVCDIPIIDTDANANSNTSSQDANDSSVSKEGSKNTEGTLVKNSSFVITDEDDECEKENDLNGEYVDCLPSLDGEHTNQDVIIGDDEKVSEKTSEKASELVSYAGNSEAEQWNTVSESDISENPVLLGPGLTDERGGTTKPDFHTNLSMNGLKQELASLIDEEGNPTVGHSASSQADPKSVMMQNGAVAGSVDWTEVRDQTVDSS